MQLVTRIITAAVLAMSPLVASGQACLEEVGRWGYGPLHAVAASDQGETVYFSSGVTLMVADVTDPGTPHVVGELQLPGVVEDLLVLGHLVMAAAGDAGLCLVDVADPAAPRLLAALATPGPALHVATHGPRAVVVSLYPADPDRFELTLVDVSVPDQPLPLGSCAAPGRPSSLAVAGDWALVATGELQVFDLSDPLHPTHTGSPMEADRVTVGDGVVLAISNFYLPLPGLGYLTWHTLTVLDPARLPAAPPLGTLRGEDQRAAAVEVEGDTAYITTGPHLEIVDMSDPSRPEILRSLSMSGLRFGDIAVRDGLAWIVDSDYGIHGVDVSDPLAVAVVSGLRHNTDWLHTREIEVVTRHAYVDTGRGVRILDLADPARPEDAALIRQWGTVTVSGRTAYVVGYDFSVYDVTNPTQPSLLGSCEARYSRGGLAVTGRHVLVPRALGGLQLIDVSKPRAPALVSSFVPPEITSEHWIRPRGVEVVGTYALVAESDHRGSDDLEGYAGGLRVLDLSDAEHLVEVARLDLPDPTSDLAVANGWAYVATTAPWVRVVDVSQPQHPVEVTTYEVRDSARSVTATPDHLFVVDGTGTVTMLDVSDPFAPVELASVDTTGDARGVAVADGFAWVPDNRAGLAVLDLAACSTGAPTAVMSWSPEEPIAWEPVQLLDASRGLPTAWSWDLGDGTTSTEQSPVHVFETPGLYRISLIASNRHGIDTTETVIKVGTLVRRPRGRLR